MVTLSYGYLNSITYECKTMGNNGYLAVLLAAVLTLPGVLIMYLLMKRFPGENLVQQGIGIMGLFCGRVMGFLYLVFLTLFFAVFSRDAINIIYTYVLQNTPFTIICTIDFLAAGYLGSRGIETISRLASFIVLPFLLVLTLLGVALIPEIDLFRLLPVFKLTFNFNGAGGLTILNIFYPIGLFALITPYLKGIQQKIPRITFLAFGILVYVSMLLSIGTIGIFGHDYLTRFAYPSLEVLRTIEQPYLLIEQAGLFMIILLFSNIIIGSGFMLYIIGLGASQVIGGWDYKRYVWLVAVLGFLLKLALPSIAITKLIVNVIAKYGWIGIWGYPLLLYLLALILKKRGGSNVP